MRKIILILFFTIGRMEVYAQKLPDLFKKEISTASGRESLFQIINYRTKKGIQLPKKVAFKYFNKHLKLQRIEALEDMMTLKDMGVDTIDQVIYPIAKINKPDYTLLFLLLDSRDIDYFGYCAVYDIKMDKVIKVLKILSFENAGDYSQSFKLCLSRLITTIYKPKEILDKSKTKRRYNFKMKFVNSQYLLDKGLSFIKADSSLSEVVNGQYTIYNSESSPDDPIKQKCD